jgi:cellulose synthase/poly-beta-1,6-N-acetylglucosamine synthase-like glycosyltransferase
VRVLVIIPTQGKRPEMLSEAVESIKAQTVPVEYAIVCGHNSIADRLNGALEKSNCDAFVVLSDDDRLAPDFIEKTVAKMEERGVDIVYTDCVIFGRRNCKAHALGEWTKQNIDRNTVPLCTSLCRKSAWQKAGRFEWVPFYDWDFWWRCFYSGATAFWLKEHLWFYRDHEDQGSAVEDMAHSRATILERHKLLRESFGKA